MARNDSTSRFDTDRRSLLQALGVAGAAGLAGCAGNGDGNGNGGNGNGGNGGNGNGNGDGNGGGQEQVFQMLEDGFEEAGFEPPYEGEIITNENPQRVDWAQIIQEEMNSTEYFDLELNQFEWGTYVGRVLAEDSVHDPALICLGWSAGFDPDAYVNFLFTSSSHTPACCNINHYSNETVDELVQEGLRTFDTDERADIYEELQREIVADSPMAFIRFGEEIDVYNSNVVGDWRAYPIASGQFTGIYAAYADQAATLLEPGAGDDGELIASISADPSNSEPTAINDTTSSMTTSLIYEGLMATNFEGEPQPSLAREVEQTDDLTFRFHLHEGVQFHPSDEFDFEGREMTAEDVKFSIERYITTSRESDVGEWLGTPEIPEDVGEDEEAEFLREEGFEGDVEVIDDYTLDITLPEPYAPFLLSVGEALVVPQDAGVPWEDDSELDLSTEPIGTGPYRFSQYDPDELWRVEQFGDYRFDAEGYPDASNIETLTMRVITETSVHQGALEAGDIDLATNFPPGEVSTFEERDGFGVGRVTAGGFDMFIYPMNAMETSDDGTPTDEPATPFVNNQVRLATNRLINREGIVQAVYDGIGQPAYAPISPLAGAFTSEEFQEEMADEYSRYYDA
jgi:peptide/nickel transport system substrate-binding protein